MPDIVWAVALLMVGFVLLVYGADFFVDGCSSIAKTLRVPSMVIGLTIVALGTSLPEAAVSSMAALSGSSGISAGNCVGSNFFNLLIVCGLCALFQPLPIDKNLRKRDYPISLFVEMLVLFFTMDFIFGRAENRIDRTEGIIMIALYLMYLVMLVIYALKNRTEEEEVKKLPIALSIVFVIGGAAAIIFGGNMVVDNASIIAKSLGMSDTLIGLTIVAFGTSLPELVTSIVAARKGELDLALGNCIGSNIANFLFVLGLAGAIRPIEISSQVMTDMIILVVVCVIVLFMILTRKEFKKKEGLVMICMYVAYMVYIFYRNFAL